MNEQESKLTTQRSRSETIAGLRRMMQEHAKEMSSDEFWTLSDASLELERPAAREGLAALVEQWRRLADEEPKNTATARARAYIFRLCADALAAWLKEKAG